MGPRSITSLPKSPSSPGMGVPAEMVPVMRLNFSKEISGEAILHCLGSSLSGGRIMPACYLGNRRTEARNAFPGWQPKVRQPVFGLHHPAADADRRHGGVQPMLTRFIDKRPRRLAEDSAKFWLGLDSSSLSSPEGVAERCFFAAPMAWWEGAFAPDCPRGHRLTRLCAHERECQQTRSATFNAPLGSPVGSMQVSRPPARQPRTPVPPRRRHLRNNGRIALHQEQDAHAQSGDEGAEPLFRWRHRIPVIQRRHPAQGGGTDGQRSVQRQRTKQFPRAAVNDPGEHKSAKRQAPLGGAVRNSVGARPKSVRSGGFTRVALMSVR